MRILTCLLGLSLLTTMACDEDDNTSDNNQPDFDAAPQVDGGGQVADAAPVDAPPASTLNVVAREQFGGNPIVGAIVLVLAEDETMASETTTDEDGLATVDIQPGDSVVVLVEEESKGTFFWAVHFVGVKAGDVLHVGRTPFGDTIGQASVSATTDVKGADFYTAYTGCGEQNGSSTTQEGPILVDMYSPCHGASTVTPVYLLASDQGFPLAYAVEAEHTFADPLTFNTWRNDFLDVRTELEGFTPGSEFASTQLYLVAPGGEDFRMEPLPILAGLPVQTNDWALPQDLASHWALQVNIDTKSFQVSNRTLVRVGEWPIATPHTTSYPEDFLPRVTSISQVGKGTGADTQVTYSVDSDGAGTPDALVMVMNFNNVEWTLVHPGTAVEVGPPNLGKPYANWIPSQKSSLNYAFALLADIDNAAGYDLLRNFIATAEGDFSTLRPFFAGGATGELHLSSHDEFFGSL
jgi:hypothetical protein